MRMRSRVAPVAAKVAELAHRSRPNLEDAVRQVWKAIRQGNDRAESVDDVGPVRDVRDVRAFHNAVGRENGISLADLQAAGHGRARSASLIRTTKSTLTSLTSLTEPRVAGASSVRVRLAIPVRPDGRAAPGSFPARIVAAGGTSTIEVGYRGGRQAHFAEGIDVPRQLLDELAEAGWSVIFKNQAPPRGTQHPGPPATAPRLPPAGATLARMTSDEHRASDHQSDARRARVSDILG